MSISARRLLAFGALAGLALAADGCDSRGPKNDLEHMETARLIVKGYPFEVWLARKPGEVLTGLMNVTEEELAPTADGADRGMLFVFGDERVLGFWMRNTIIPLDIAYLRSDGTIVRTHTMAPLETRTYSSVEPARFALEVNAGRFKELGVIEGDRVEIPPRASGAARAANAGKPGR